MNKPWEKPFVGDTFVANKVAKLIKQHNIRTIIETGTHKGVTTKYFAKFGIDVHSTEIDKYRFEEAQKFLAKHKNVNLHLGDSIKTMPIVLVGSNRPILFFLDAHNNKQNIYPILDELNIIAEYGCSNSVIIIHDFKVPGKDFGFDSWNNGQLDWDFIKDHISKIYNGQFAKEYNEKACGLNRGVIYITPK